MQTQLSETNAPSNILSKPEHILSFVKHALESAVVTSSDLTPNGHEAGNALSMDNLRIVPEDNRVSEGDDSDDEDDTIVDTNSDEITNTAVDLLLSILEGISVVPVLRMQVH